MKNTTAVVRLAVAGGFLTLGKVRSVSAPTKGCIPTVRRVVDFNLRIVSWTEGEVVSLGTGPVSSLSSN